MSTLWLAICTYSVGAFVYTIRMFRQLRRHQPPPAEVPFYVLEVVLWPLEFLIRVIRAYKKWERRHVRWI